MIDYASLSNLVLAILLIIGLVVLSVGGEWLARGASGIALIMKINPVVVGLTIVSIATSMPELITCFIASVKGSPDIAVGNIIGSNLGNSGLIMGVAAIIFPVTIQSRLIKLEMPILMLATIAFYLMSMGGFLLAGQIGRIEGFILLAGAIGYLVFLVIQAKTSKKGEPIPGLEDEVAEAPKSPWLAVGLVVGGACGLALGAELLVGSAVQIATRLNVSELIIGLTVVAIGTSLPELAAAIAAALKKESDLIAGNIIGSNIFNILLIGGATATMNPIPVQAKIMRVEFPAILLMTAILWAAIGSEKKVSRTEGVLLTILYVLMLGFAALA